MSYRKYRNKRSVDAEGNKFDSNMERRRWEELKIMEAGGLIFNPDCSEQPDQTTIADLDR